MRPLGTLLKSVTDSMAPPVLERSDRPVGSGDDGRRGGGGEAGRRRPRGPRKRGRWRRAAPGYLTTTAETAYRAEPARAVDVRACQEGLGWASGAGPVPAEWGRRAGPPAAARRGRALGHRRLRRRPGARPHSSAWAATGCSGGPSPPCRRLIRPGCRRATPASAPRSSSPCWWPASSPASPSRRGRLRHLPRGPPWRGRWVAVPPSLDPLTTHMYAAAIRVPRTPHR